MEHVKIFLKKNLKTVVAFIVGGIVFGTLNVYATAILNSNDVSYSNENSGLNSSNVQGAIDEVAEKTKSHCPDGYSCSYKCKGNSCPTCVRAKSLHTDNDFTYGNLGTKGVLNSGDAFDCDVNADGIYDATTERFYYVTDLDSNDSVAVMIYYNNVSGGQMVLPNEQSPRYQYSTDDIITQKSILLADQFPTYEQWRRLNLYSGMDKILTGNGTEYLYNTYIPLNRDTAYKHSLRLVARLLTLQEVKKTCNLVHNFGTDYNFDNCLYLNENDNGGDGYWLETPEKSEYNRVYVLHPSNNSNHINVDAISGYHGVRPVIEVDKTDIQY